MSDNNILTPEQLAEIQARCDKATKGPWKSQWDRSDDDDPADRWAPIIFSESEGIPDEQREVVGVTWYDGPIAGCNRENSDFIASARTDIPALLAHIAALQEQVDAADNDPFCVRVRFVPDENGGHIEFHGKRWVPEIYQTPEA